MNKIMKAIITFFLGLVSAIWGMILTGLILYHIGAPTFMWCLYVLYVPLTITAMILLNKANTEGIDD